MSERIFYEYVQKIECCDCGINVRIFLYYVVNYQYKQMIFLCDDCAHRRVKTNG